MNYYYIKVFYIVCKHQNLSKAASELEITQPAVSRIISSIEKKHHVKLFTRSKTGVTPTREGLFLFDIIKNPLMELEKIDSDLVSLKNLRFSTVHIGVTSTALYCFLFKHLDEIKKKFPYVFLRTYTSSSAKLLDMVDKGSIDFALITTPFQVSDDIEIVNIHPLNNILVAPISYKEKINGSVSIKSLIKYPFILLSPDMQFREHIDEYFRKNGVKLVPAYETDSSSLLVSFVENDCGLAFIPEEMAEKSIAEGKCFKVDLIEKMPNRYVTFAFNKNKSHANVIYEIRDEILKDVI